jgi:hypothetical protein
MQRMSLALLVLILLPTSVLAARLVAPSSFHAAQSLVAASSSPGNAYAVGASVVLTAPVAGDILAIGGSVVNAAPIAGDAALFGGSVSSRASVTGDVRVMGGGIDIAEPIGGDLVAAGFSMRDTGRASGSVFIIAANTTMTNGAEGPVTIYGNNISLGGDFAGDVQVVASGRVALAPGARIRGAFSYEAPDVAVVPPSVKIDGKVTYTNASYLPDVGTSRALAYLSIGFFMIARIVGALILAGLLAGLFPSFARLLTAQVTRMRVRSRLLMLLLGFGIFVATPIVIALLLLTFVGIGLALLLLILYALLLVLAFVYAGIVTGHLLARRFAKREAVLWHDGVLGMSVLSIVTLVPFVGLPIVFALMLFAVGTLLQIFFHFAFPHSDEK